MRMNGYNKYNECMRRGDLVRSVVWVVSRLCFASAQKSIPVKSWTYYIVADDEATDAAAAAALTHNLEDTMNRRGDQQSYRQQQ